MNITNLEKMLQYIIFASACLTLDWLHCLWTYLLCFPDGGSHVFEVVRLFIDVVG